MTHYTSNVQVFFIGVGVRRSVNTLCGLILDEVEDYGSPRPGSRATCPVCLRMNGELHYRGVK